MCFNEQTINVPVCEAEVLEAEGATCGPCEEPPPPGECCPDVPVVDGKIDMCQNGHTINVSTNACPGLIRAGATCGPCEDLTISKVDSKSSKKDKDKKVVKTKKSKK